MHDEESGVAAHLMSEELRLALFGDDHENIHGPWRKMISSPEFRHREGATGEERLNLAYARLRTLAASVDSGEELAADAARLAALHEWTMCVDGSLATLAGIHYNLFLGSLVDRPSAGRDLADFTALRRTGTFLCTELEHGNDAAALETTATYRPGTGDFVLHTPHAGARKYMPNTSPTGGPKSAVVAARLVVDGTDHGVFLFLTPLTDEEGPLPGVRVSRLPERTGAPVDHCLTSFDHVRLPFHAMVAGDHGQLAGDGTFTGDAAGRRERFLQSIGRVTVGKLCMSAAALGAARTALTIAVRYGHHRHISGPKPLQRVPVFRHRTHHGPLVSSLATAYAMTFLHREAVRRWTAHTDADRTGTERLVAVAKGWITWRARDIAQECRERCGAQGFFYVNGLAEFAGNIEGTMTAEGDNLAIWVKAASEMISGSRDRWSPPPPPGDRELTDPDFLHRLLAAVEHHAFTRARTRLRQGPRGDRLARWNAAATPALHMVGAHAELQAADALLAAATAARTPAARAVLHDLHRLFALQRIAEHTGDLLVEGELAPEHVRQLPTLVDALVERLAGKALLLTEAFDVPEEILADIPIANASYAAFYGDAAVPAAS
ncbi:acyl-CoA dehydrogenase [Streptomyces sp. NPDC053079]|uniref:acyl-CoA dehydrogenase family protein n=1 Tax=Streptomyces sp. NPDC053079 TaxID=3365697 RepID=UPI0037D2F066